MSLNVSVCKQKVKKFHLELNLYNMESNSDFDKPLNINFELDNLEDI